MVHQKIVIDTVKSPEEECVPDAHLVGQEQDTEKDQESAANEGNEANVWKDVRKPAGGVADEVGQDQERRGETEGKNKEEERALRRRSRGGGKRQDRTKDGSDARRPTERESGAEDERAQRIPRMKGGAAEAQAPFDLQKTEARQREKIHHKESEKDNEGAAELREPRPVLAEGCAGQAEEASENNEDGAEAKCVEQAVQEYLRTETLKPLRVVQVLLRNTADETEIPRHERQSARREEREEASDKSGDDKP